MIGSRHGAGFSGLAAGFILAALACGAAHSAVLINELQAATTDRLLQWPENGMPLLGAAPSWTSPDFDDTAWPSGPGPLGYGESGIATSVDTNAYGAVSLYVRKTFFASADEAASDQALTLSIDFDDSFVAYVNGVDVARRAMAAEHGFIYHDQTAYNARESGVPEAFSLGPASSLLREGKNVLAVQVHNIFLGSSDLVVKADLAMAGRAELLVNHTGTWRYMVGTCEPSGGVSDEDCAFCDWIELYNNGSQVNLGGWSLTDDPLDPGKWRFPSVTLPSGQYLVVFASGKDRTSPYLHTSFKLSSEGEYLGLFDNAGGLVDVIAPAFPHQSPFYSYGRASNGSWAYFETVTPGRPNSLGRQFQGILDPPRFTAEGGLYDSPFDLTLSSAPATTIRYTLSERAPLGQDGVRWEFNGDGDPEGWSPWHSTSAFEVSGGALHFSITNTDPFIGAPSFALDASLHHYVVIRMRMSIAGRCQIFFVTQTQTGWDEPKSRFFESGPANEFTDYVLDLSDHELWNGYITGLRVDPPSEASTGDVAIDFIRVIAEPDTSPSEEPSPASPFVEGREPSEHSGAVYTGPIHIEANTIIRARAFREGFIPSPTVTHTYIFGTGLPGDDRPALHSLPILAVVGDKERSLVEPHGFMAIRGGSYTGQYGWWEPQDIDDYNHPIMHGRAFERPVAVEFFDPLGGAGFCTDVGMRLARSDVARPSFRWVDGCWVSSGKWSFRLYFRNDYGESPLDFPLYPEEHSSNRFDVLAIRTFGGDWKNPFINEELTRRLQIEMGAGGSYGIYVNLFINGQYKAYLNLCERLDESYFQHLHNSDNEWDVLKKQVNRDFQPVLEVQGGDLTAWNSLIDYVRSHDLAVYANYLEAAGRVDVPQFIDWILANVYAGMIDWPWNNWIAARERTPEGIWHFYIWDADYTFRMLEQHGHGGVNHRTMDNIEYQGNQVNDLYRALKNSPEFRVLWWDRVHKHFGPGGALSKEKVAALFHELRAQVEPSLDHMYHEPFDTWILDQWIPNREEILFQQFSDFGLAPALDAPIFAQTSESITITNPNTDLSTEIRYTLNGADPRRPGTGTPVGYAAVGKALVPLSGYTVVKARIYGKIGDRWSALEETKALAEEADYAALRITEFMYHPADGGAEFIELRNIGDNPLDVSGVYFSDGVDYAFDPGTIVNPEQYVLLVSSETEFAAAYPGVPYDGVYDGQLSNGGERLALNDPSGIEFLSMTYSDEPPWPTAPDGQGFSLVIIDEGADPDNPYNWRASSEMGGGPGLEDEDPTIPQVLVNEALAHTDLPERDAIEIYNPTDQTADVRGWFLTDSRTDPKRARIPFEARFVLPPGAYAVIDDALFGDNPGEVDGVPLPGFGLSAKGGEGAYIYSANEAGLLTGYSHGFEFGPSESGVSFGRHVTSDAKVHYVAQRQNTFGALNAGPKVGPLVISEIHYHPPGDGVEYLELTNISDQVVSLWDTAPGGNPANTYVISGIGFVFEQGVEVGPGERLLIVNCEPADFLAVYDVPADVTVLGPFGNASPDGEAALSNGGERITLEWPDAPELETAMVFYIIMDEVDYDDEQPWAPADGNGLVLQRVRLDQFGNEPHNWTSAMPSYPPLSGAVEPMVHIPVHSSEDDAEESPDGGVDLDDLILELTDGPSGAQTVGLRFTDVGVPRRAEITRAYLQFSAAAVDAAHSSIVLCAQATSSPPAFSSTAFDISSRSVTSETVSWAPPAWSIIGERDAAQQTPDLSAVLQEVVAKPGWDGGNAIVMLLTGSGVRRASSWDGSAQNYGNDSAAPVLHIEFEVGKYAVGDINQDGSVNALDVQLVINAALGFDIGDFVADVNLDESVNALDVQLVINAALGLPVAIKTEAGNGGGWASGGLLHRDGDAQGIKTGVDKVESWPW